MKKLQTQLKNNIEKRILNNLKEDKIIISKLEKIDENISEAGFKDVSIKKSILDAINNKTQEYCQKTSWLTGTNIVATNIDYADTVGQYYKLFENFVDTKIYG